MSFSDAPPAGPPWDTPFAEAPFAFVDLEMTGLDSAKDRVIEVCIERVRAGEREAFFSTLVNPQIPMGAQHVHGIDDAMVKDAPRFHAVAPEIEKILGGAVFVAHGAKYDAEFLNMELGKANSPLRVVHWIDTLKLARRALGLDSHSLHALCKHFQIVQDKAHRAEADVSALRTIFARIVALLGPVSPRDLWEVKIAERLARASVLSACEAARLAGTEVRITYRPSRKKAEILGMIVTGIASDMDPPRVMGYLVTGRSRRELRADRILRVEIPT
jgi:DNA polymerase-3 subunit epsilon